ncbi:MAG TPA: two-component system sensor histidine kinase KdpD [Candidatus Polarisedimenticolia bacterium]|nr:two-component system sensor histidine kinase KdpD [Candidatus Polarisedimenticolia bacterium]
MSERRPDPDRLLEQLKREESRAQRGRLKVFFGANAGVGKTYAMLSAGQALRREGKEVVAGIVETHGRNETEALLAGLEVLPSRRVDYQGKQLREFDLDAALRRHPAVLLVDELAHDNLPGSRHPKRWQDVEELLDAGIDVYSTLNVQHLESLNDVVGQVTGVRVRETIPDKVFENADEVALIDLTPDELLTRLRDGKVYLPEQAQVAARNFFRKGNLIALRELALRQTADRVDEQMRAYRLDRSIRQVWPAKERLLVCVGTGPGMEKLIREAARLAGRLEAEWYAVYVETPALQRLPETRRNRVLRMARLAQEMGAETETLTAPEPAEALIEYARSNNITRILVGRDRSPRWRFWAPTLSERIGRRAPDLDVVLVGLEEPPGGARPAPAEPETEEGLRDRRKIPLRRYGHAALTCLATTAVAFALRVWFDPANIVMLFLLSVVLVAVWYGRRPAILAAFLNVALFDFFFVPPTFTMGVHDVQYLLTFAVMLAVALVIGHLTSDLRYQARVAIHRERRARVLYELGRELSGAISPGQIAGICDRYSEETFRAVAAIMLPDAEGRIQPPGPESSATPNPVVDLGTAQWVFDRNQPAGFGTDTLPGIPVQYVPLKAPGHVRGVLALQPSNPRLLLVPEQRRLLETFAALIGIALERVHYAEMAQGALLQIESERLRSSLLSALSHDLRTPMTSVLGLAESLPMTTPTLSQQQREMVDAIREEAARMSTLMTNLLEMARLESGEVRLNRQWQRLDELADAALRGRGEALRGRRIELKVPPDLPMARLDAVLIERVLANLLENAAKYTPPGSRIRLGARNAEDHLEVFVADEGPGIPPEMLDTIFDKFTRANMESAQPGVGLGLSICRAIVEAHGGIIQARNLPEGGAEFRFTLPLSTEGSQRAPGEVPEARAEGGERRA